MEVSWAIYQSGTHNTYRQAMFFVCFQGKQFALEFTGFVGIGWSKRSILGSKLVSRYPMHSRGTAMHNALQLLLTSASLEQVSGTFDMGVVIDFRRYAGMIQFANKMINGSNTIYSLFHLFNIVDFTANDGDSLAKLHASLLLITGQNAHILVLFHQFGG